MAENFIFDPTSLVLHKGSSPVKKASECESEDDFQYKLLCADFLARYLHERVHWIQHFSTFTGLLSIFRAELQTQATIDLLADTPDDCVDILPLRAKYPNSTGTKIWHGLELLDAALAGERTQKHFETGYGNNWESLMRAGVKIFSSTCYILPEINFTWPTNKQLATVVPLHVEKFSMVDDGYGSVSGAATIAEIHAWSAQITSLSNFVEKSSQYSLAVDQTISAKASKLRSIFYKRAGLADGWKAEVICSQAAYYALNAPIALFFPILSGKKDDLIALAPIAKFLAFADNIKEKPLEKELDVPQEGMDFFNWSKRYLERFIGYDLFEKNLQFIEEFVKSASYSPASTDKLAEDKLGDCLKLSFLGKQVREMVAVARTEPAFVMCPGLLYELDRRRFRELFEKVGNFLERTEGVGYSPSPGFSKSMEPSEYVRQVAFAVQADAARTMMVRDLSALKELINDYCDCDPDFRDPHLAGVWVGLRSLCLPQNLFSELIDQVHCANENALRNSAEHS